MSTFTLTLENRAQLAETIADDAWIVACLCAAWCDVCNQYRPWFEELAERHPDKHFVWIDIEDQADVVGELDVENFPTLLIQRGNTVAFFGTVQPEAHQAHRLVLALAAKTDAELAADAQNTAERRAWQHECNLRSRLDEALQR